MTGITAGLFRSLSIAVCLWAMGGCMSATQLNRHGALPPYVRSINTIRLFGSMDRKLTDIYLAAGDHIGIFAEGTVYAYRGAPAESAKYTSRLLHGIQDDTGKAIWLSGMQHPILKIPESGRLFLGLSRARSDLGMGYFDVTVIVWQDASYEQMASFLQQLKKENPDKEAVDIALNQADIYRRIEARREETQSALTATKKELKALSVQTPNPDPVGVEQADKGSRIEYLESRLSELTATLADMERMKADLDQQRSRADRLSAELEERTRREQEERRRLQAGAARPPMLFIASPSTGAATPGSQVMLSGVAEDDRGIISLKIMINGRSTPLSGARGLSSTAVDYPKRLQFNQALPLEIGDNRIRILVTDTDELTSEQIVSVRRNPLRRNVWAVVVGINRYARLPRLKYAVNDARAFYDFLINANRIPAEKVTLLTDAQADLKNLRSVLGTELKRNAGQDDRVIIYFAGHGATERDTMSPDGDGLEKYLLPYDAEPDDLYATAMPMREIAHIFDRIQSQQLIFIVDACYSGASGGRTVPTAGYRATLSDSFLDRLSSGRGKVIITASSANEVSIERDELAHGVFTYFLLEGLRGGADVDADGVVTVDEAYRYTATRVIDATGKEQHPVKKGSVEGLLVMSIVK